MSELVAFLARGVVSKPDAVQVESTEGEASVELRLTVAPQDMSALEGVTLDAIRTVLASSSGRRKAVLEVVAPDSDAS